MTSDGMPPPTRAPPPAPDPELNQCINTIITESKSQSARGQVDLNVAMVGLITIVAREQRLNSKDSSIAFFTSETPAMREIITNRELFQVLISMLSGDSGTSGLQSLPDSSLDGNKQGRKRSPSEDASFHAKKKQMLTPPPPNRQQLYSVRQTSQSQLAATGISSMSDSSTGNKQVFAATVLYSVLQHIDHWPIQLLRVYAEDAFGQRMWVDNDICKDLVSNLQMALNPNADEPIDAATSSIADEVENYFSNLLTRERNGVSAQSTSNQVVISSQQRAPSAKEVRNQAKQAEAMDDSSSSGEEEVLESNSMAVDSNAVSFDKLSKLFQQSKHSRQQIRSRYVGHNLELAYEAISDALADRLNSKSKQNSRLVQALPRFLCISRVRCLSSRHLERWLQSPALAGLARNLFANMTKNLSNLDPPLPDDTEVIDNILKMKLKANQLSMHVENITLIAKMVPTHTVAKQIFKHCLVGETSNDGGAVMNPGHEHLEILRSVYIVLDSRLAAKSLALAVLELVSISPTESHSGIIRLVVNTLGSRFDIFTFTKSIIKSKKGVSKNISTATESARLIFDCALLAGFVNPDSNFRNNMLSLRKTILRWCLTDLGGVYYNQIRQEELSLCNDSYDGNGAVTRGPGESDFSSYFNLGSIEESKKKNRFMYKFMLTVRSLLFLNGPSTSKELKAFVGRDLEKEESECINFCSQYSDIDNDMLEIVLSSSQVMPATAISIIENLVLGCSKGVQDIPISCETIWKLYEISEYTLEFQSKVVKEDFKLPRLAHSGLWWRVTAIALVLCGLSSNVGSMWKEHPTLRALIKMTTAQKYRFPTADCDETEKETVRREEAKVKEQEAKIAEVLFTVPKPSKTAKPKPVPQPVSTYRTGLRSSARQREKRDKFLAQEEERIAAAKHAEQVKLRRQLRALQKSIMIWDPVQVQRKPPKESIQLILAINDSFGLAEKFRASVDPDYLLQTIGFGRSAIERAYDWLIPIISQNSEIIHRLQPSSTCFLLLKAYGAEAGKNKELIDLSAPLLSHVGKCLNGEFGERHSLLALELLLTDVADDNADRRRCSRRVLQQAIPNDFGICGWVRKLLSSPNANVLIPLTTEYLSQALLYERGKVLSTYVLMLHEYNKFILENKLQHDFHFVSTVCHLVSSRPHVCTDAMDSNSELQTLILSEIVGAFDKALAQSKSDKNSDKTVSLTLPAVDQGCTTKTISVSACLVKAAVVVVSDWKDIGDDNDNANNEAVTTSEDLFRRLLGYLIIPVDTESSKTSVSGLASARYTHDNTPAASIDDWISLARAKSCVVAKHAALSAPQSFLPRLLLCCGMSKLSFSTMLSRINKLGDFSSDPGKAFRELLSPAAISHWGLTKFRGKSVIKRKILGRILAYTRTDHNNLSNTNDDDTKDLQRSSFVLWLLSECKPSEKSKKFQSNGNGENGLNFVKSYIAQNSNEERLSLFHRNDEETLMWVGDNIPPQKAHTPQQSSTDGITKDFICYCIDSERYAALDESLQSRERCIAKSPTDNNPTATLLLAVYQEHQDNDSFVGILLKWIPRLCLANQGNSMWQTIFIDLVEKYHVQFDTCITIVSSCAVQCSQKCQRWIMKQGTKHLFKSSLSMQLVLRFLVLSFEFTMPLKDSAGCLVDLSLESISHEYMDHQNCTPSVINARNILPDWLALILNIATMGKSFIDASIGRILNQINERPYMGPVLSAVILRLYTLHPSTATLTEPKLKTILVEGARNNSTAWLNYQCPLDCQIKAMISNLSKSPHKPLLQSIIQIVNQHPLLLMRHLHSIEQGLVGDGSGLDSTGQPLMKRGRIQGKPPQAVAQINGQEIKVFVVHWGYSFSEPVWSCVLDLLLSIPAEVLFKVGVELGLPKIILVYSRLFSVHANELNAESNITQLRAKFDRLTSSFMKCNPEEYQQVMPN